MSVWEFSKELKYRLWRTKGSRFNACRRMERKQNILTYITSISSVHLLTIAIIQLSSLVTLSPGESKLLSFVTIVLSIIIFAYSLIEGGKNYGLQSEKFHACGLEIDRLYSGLELAEAQDSESGVEEASRQYALILEKYSLNHGPVDDLYFQSQHCNETGFPHYKDKSNYQKFKVWYQYKWSDCTRAVLLSVIPMIITIVILR